MTRRLWGLPPPPPVSHGTQALGQPYRNRWSTRVKVLMMFIKERANGASSCTADEKEEMARLRQRGLGWHEIGDQLDRSQHICRKLVDRKDSIRGRFSPEEDQIICMAVEQVMQMRDRDRGTGSIDERASESPFAGLPWVAIAAQLPGRDDKTVSKAAVCTEPRL